jgi:hypothetical protein
MQDAKQIAADIAKRVRRVNRWDPFLGSWSDLLADLISSAIEARDKEHAESQNEIGEMVADIDRALTAAGFPEFGVSTDGGITVPWSSLKERVNQLAAERGRLAEALREARCWLSEEGPTPRELGAKYDTHAEVMDLIDATLIEVKL